MTGAFRTPAGGRIRRDRRLAFRFDGRDYLGCEGDTLASALLANGVTLVGRSFKYHRPRGIVAAGAEEPNALVTVDRGGGRITPNLRATQVALYDGLHAHSQNRWPSLRFDAGAVAGAVSPLLGAGFYYKTFKWPRAFWRLVYEPAIRAAAGLGRAPRLPDADRYIHHYAHCEVLVVGGGPAGLAAALAACGRGARVILCDEQEEIGGSLLAETAEIDGKPAAAWLDEARRTLAGHDGVTLLPRTTAFGWYPDKLIGLSERVTDHLASPDPNLPRERLWQVRAAAVVLAAGAIERPLVFPHNDRPGIMLAEAARIYLQRYGVKVGGRVAIVTADDSAYRTAGALQAAGVEIAAIADLRSESNSAAMLAAYDGGLPVFAGSAVTGTIGRHRVRAVTLAGRAAPVACDTLLTCGGWTPSVHLFAQARGRLRFEATLGAFVPDEGPPDLWCAGACAGRFDLAGCLDTGYAAGEAAARSRAPGRRFTVTGVAAAGEPGLPPQPPPHRTASIEPPHRAAFVDLQNDVSSKDVHSALDEGFHAIEHLKRYTTTGMATDQGKTANIVALTMAAAWRQQSVPAVGHTTFRAPYTPVTFGGLAGAGRGALLEPERHAPLHDWAAAHGAVFEDVGTWKRARCFPLPGESLPGTVARECRAVRETVGALDASTLGKIEVVGPDAAQFLDLLYPIAVSAMGPGRCRYSVLLNERGFVLDDGIIARLSADRFHVTTTSGGAAAVLHHMEDYRQTEFPHLRVWLTSTTEQWGVIAVQGPQARSVLAPLVQGADLGTMPHMSVRACHVLGVAARLFRVSFTGELGYEINLPAGQLAPVWEALIAAGAMPYGTDAMHVLRAEKGYIVIGQETDGTVTLDDLGMAHPSSQRKRDFVGKRSMQLPDLRRSGRRQLVGLLTEDPNVVLEEGAQIVADPQVRTPMPGLGHVTSAYWSGALQRSIALALLANGRAQQGNILYVPMPNGVIPVLVSPPLFYDREGARLHG